MTASRTVHKRSTDGTPQEREVRYLQTTEVRAVGGTSSSGPLQLEGYGAIFNSFAQLPGFRERILPGAFKRSIENKQDVVCLWNHNPDIILGRSTSGTLRLNQDARGLHYICDLPNTEAARGYHESVKRGDINGCSFGFQLAPEGAAWSEGRDADGSFFVQRDIKDVTKLLDVSPVTYPAYGGTSLDARSSVVVPAELRSAVDAKNASLRLKVVTPPSVIPATTQDIANADMEIVNRRRRILNDVLNS